MQPKFVHLRLHTEYSIHNGLIRIEDLIAAAIKHRMPSLAVTDHMNLFAAVKFYQAALAAGIKPILGADCWISSANVKQPFRISLLCQNYQGYQNLTRLISRAYLEGRQSDIPLLQKEWLTDSVDGLIALSGANEGDVGQALLLGKNELAESQLSAWLQLFPDRFYVELSRTGRSHDEIYLTAAVELAKKFDAPVVATNDILFIEKDDFDAHEARVCIQSGNILNDPRRPRNYSPEQYFRSSAEMETLFADFPAALANTVEIAKRCNLELSLGKSFLPSFPIPQGLSAETFLTQEAAKGLQHRAATSDFIKEKEQIYSERLKFELNVISNMGFAGYFLIVADFIRWAKENDIPVGPGRGSGAGSLVAYALLITDLDPIQFDLLFERFLNPERVSMPDFDIDFCMDGRDRVIDYVTERYGRTAVSQIITFGSMAARAVVRDVGRVLAYPYGMVDKLAKLIPFEVGITLEKALEQEDELQQRYTKEDDVRVLIDLARKLEGIVRNVGKHAAGVVIAPSQLTDFTPLYCEAGGDNLVTQFDMDDIQTVGLVKFDFLGLRTLTIINWAVRAINDRLTKTGNELIKIEHIPIDDAATFALLKTCATTAVFQLESRGMKDLVKRLGPDCLEDVIALVALFRPGPLQSGMVDDFINRKHGRAKVEYMHPLLEPILRPTYGIILYQEQVMQIAQVLAGYTLGAADLLRRAMGKKKPEEMAKQREIFVSGAKARTITEAVATNIFNLMEKFADYGFNRSHSAAYALVSYQTAWLKAHYPAEFMAAVLSSDMHHTDKVVALLEECRAMKLKILPPNINQGQFKFTIDAQGSIVYGLGAIKGMGEAAVESIVAAREKDGAFKDLFDLCLRIDPRKVNRRVLEVLIRSGSLDFSGANRATMTEALDAALMAAEQKLQDRLGGQGDLFGDSIEFQNPQMTFVPEWSADDRLFREKETLGFYLNGHPLQKYEKELIQFVTAPLLDLNGYTNRSVIIAGWVVSLRSLQTKRGDRMAIVTLEDMSGRLELAVFSEAYTNYKDLLYKDQLLVVEGEVSMDEFTGNSKVMARRILNIDQARINYGQELMLNISEGKLEPTLLEQLKENLTPFLGSCPVTIKYFRLDSVVSLGLGSNWRVRPTDVLFENLRKMFGNEAVTMVYKGA